MNWLGDEPLEDLAGRGIDVLARIRSSGSLRTARLYPAPGGVTVELAEGEDGVSPGQACVLYDAEDGMRLLGGGLIASANWAAHRDEAASGASALAAGLEPMLAGSH